MQEGDWAASGEGQAELGRILDILARSIGVPTAPYFFFSSRRRHTRWPRDRSSDVCSSDLAKAAIAECKSAGIRVRMITGDHAVTAAAIGGELGIEGRAITGAQFAAMSDEELAKQIEEIGVIARVAPEDKVRLVATLQKAGQVVAMTGDGV